MRPPASTMAFASEELAYFYYGDCSFLLQNFFVKELAENFVMHLLVENVDHWHEHITAQNLLERFGVKVGMPEDRPWAMRLHVPRPERGLVAYRAKHSSRGRVP